MNLQSPFSYQCHQCGRCCHNQAITLSPVDVIAIARAAGITTGEAVARYTLRRGSLLRFAAGGECAALEGVRCTIHWGRPLACRLYPLGLERAGAQESYVRLEPAAGSTGVYGDDGSIGEFLAAQGVGERLALNELYRPLMAPMRDRVVSLTDFEIVEPREFWRHATAEALRESNFDSNRIIDAMFDADGAGCCRESVEATVQAHLTALKAIAAREADAGMIAAAGVLLAVSLGYSPAEAIASASSVPKAPPAKGRIRDLTADNVGRAFQIIGVADRPARK